jgi:hypothetical protein
MTVEDLLSLLDLKKSTDVFFLDAPMDPEEEAAHHFPLGGVEDSGFEGRGSTGIGSTGCTSWLRRRRRSC